LRARRLLPDAAIGADVMTGFPGETEAEFEQTRDFIARLPFTYLHVFTYSERPGTPAAAAGGRVPIPVRKHRNRVLRELGEAKNLEFRRRFAGGRLSVVTLEEGFPALSSNYLKVELSVPRPANTLAEVEIGAVTGSGLRERDLFPVLG
jgi:threonylcarbamoyladenosine tRNA methylthiotransferase MtaB